MASLALRAMVKRENCPEPTQWFIVPLDRTMWLISNDVSNEIIQIIYNREKNENGSYLVVFFFASDTKTIYNMLQPYV